MLVKYALKLAALSSVLMLAPVLALAASKCPAIVQTALAAADQLCAATKRNQACYGHVAMTVEAQPNVSDFKFEKAGDVVNLADLKLLRLTPLNEQTGDWGVAMLRLQANLPDTLPGQNVTFLLFGDAEVTNAVNPGDSKTADLHPMQAFYLHTGVGDAACDEAPESGLLVQTPEGVGEVSLTINEVKVQMGSTVFFQADPDTKGDMTVNTLEGAAYLNIGQQTQPVVAGTRLRVSGLRKRLAEAIAPAPGAPSTDPLSVPSGGGANGDNQSVPSTPPEAILEAYNEKTLNVLPLRLLQRKIRLRRALTQLELRRIRELVRSGKVLCGGDLFPVCDKFQKPPVNPVATLAAPLNPTVVPPAILPTALPASGAPSLPEPPKLPGG
jgi:hypothetical protein